MTRLMIVVMEGYIAGGADRVLSQLLPYFNNLRIELLINTNLDTSVLLSRPLPANVSLRTYSWITPADLSNWAASAGFPLMKFARTFLSILLRYPVNVVLFLHFLCYLRMNTPDILFINNGGYPGGYACRMAAAAAVVLGRIHIVHLVHSMASFPRQLFLPLEWIIDRTIERRGYFVAVSDAVSKSLHQVYKLKAKVVTIRNGLQPASPSPPPLCGIPLQFLQVGYLCQIKNQELSIRALGVLAHQGFKGIRITFAGKETEIGYQNKLMVLAKKLGVSDQVSFIGFIKNIEELYGKHDAILVTSIVEGMPMCILEAMRAGRAVISSSVGGVSELVDDTKTGFLLRSSQPTELAEIWKLLLKNPDTLVDMGGRAYQRFMDEFTLDTLAAKYLKLMNTLISN